jgi:hypothetical protein
MRRTIVITTAAVLTAMTFATAPAFAAQRDRRGPQVSRSEGSRSEASRGSQGSAQPRVESRAVEQRAVPRRDVAAPAAPVAPVAVAPRAVPRGSVAPAVAAPYVSRPYVSRPYYGRPYYGGSYYYARPYVFRPRWTIGFGFYAGYPVPYDYAYPYPVPVYGYAAPSTPVVVGPGSTQYGGVSLEVSPSDASVYVDGGYAGLVRDFDGTQGTLTLANGRHEIEISAPGYEPMTLDVDTVPGEIVPYRGDLQPLR